MSQLKAPLKAASFISQIIKLLQIPFQHNLAYMRAGLHTR